MCGRQFVNESKTYVIVHMGQECGMSTICGASKFTSREIWCCVFLTLSAVASLTTSSCLQLTNSACTYPHKIHMHTPSSDHTPHTPHTLYHLRAHSQTEPVCMYRGTPAYAPNTSSYTQTCSKQTRSKQTRLYVSHYNRIILYYSVYYI